MKVKKGDNVMIIAGKDRGKSGKILNVFLGKNRIVVDGFNLVKKRIKPKKQGEKGQTASMPAPLNVSNVMIICKNCGRNTRIGYKILENKNKIRICKKCGEEI